MNILNYFFLVTLFIVGIGCAQDDQIVSPPSPNPSLGIVGDPTDITTSTESGLLIMGGSRDVDEAIMWMIEKSGGGDFVVIRSKGTDAYNDYIFELSNVNSVETLLINSRSLASDSSVIKTIKNAEALFIAGGDQYDYVSYWKDTPLEDAINYLKNDKKVPIGGTSAGAAIMGEFYFDAANGTVYTEEALKNPYDSLVSIQKGGFIENEFLKNTITDTHYAQRERQGRHTVFLARMINEWNAEPKGIGLDERTAVCIDDTGLAKVFGSNHAYFIDASFSKPEIVERDKPLHWFNNMKAVKVFKILGTKSGENSFNLQNWSSETSPVFDYWYIENGVFSGF
tara:strand:+ start:25321 stop:26340 length:1020 start_codon:yes stop_codon:yes gene_type:complete